MRLCVGRDWALLRARDVLAAVAARTSPSNRRAQLAGEHSRGFHMSHQKRDNLLERRVRDTRPRVLECQPECRIPVPLALHHQDFRVRADNKVNEREDRIRGGAPSLHFARELFQIDVSELNSVVFVKLSGQVDHVEVTSIVTWRTGSCGLTEEAMMATIL